MKEYKEYKELTEEEKDELQRIMASLIGLPDVPKRKYDEVLTEVERKLAEEYK